MCEINASTWTSAHHYYIVKALTKLYEGSIKALLRFSKGSIKAVLRLYQGSVKALLRLYKGKAGGMKERRDDV